MDYNNLDEEVRVSLNKDEEIKKLTLEEDLSEIKRTQLILLRGQQRQKLAIYHNLGGLLNRGFDQLYQYVKADLLEQTEEFQVEAAKSLQSVTSNLKEVLMLSLYFLQLYNLNLGEQWVPIFQLTLSKLHYPDHQVVITKCILSLTENHQPEVGRIVGAKMLASMALLLKDQIKGPLLDRARLLCSDSDPDVKAVVAGELLLSIMQNLTGQLLDSYVVDKVFELFYDSNTQVRRCIIETFYQTLGRIPRGYQNERILGAFLDGLSTSCIEILISAVKYSGQAFMMLQDISDEEFGKKFAGLYSRLGQHKNDDIRKWYLYNLPGILTNLTGMGFCQAFAPYEYIILKDVVSNRVQAIKIVHEIMKLFDEDKVQQKFGSLVECIIVHEPIDMVLKLNIGEVLQAFRVIKDDEMKQHYNEIVINLGKHYLKSLNNYNHNEQFLLQMLTFQNKINVAEFDRHFLQTLFKEQSSIRNDKLCAQNIAMFFGQCGDFEIQQRIKQVMNEIFYKGNHNKRIRYIHWVSELPQYISRKRFHDLNCTQILNYCSDECDNVKIALIRTLPKFHHYLTPQEYGLMKLMQGRTIQQLIGETFNNLKQVFSEELDNDLMAKEATQLQQYNKQKQPIQAEQAVQFAKQFAKRIIPKTRVYQSMKTPSSHSSRNEKSLGDITPSQVVQQRRYTDVSKVSKVGGGVKPSGFNK